jgi:hypothetical protein
MERIPVASSNLSSIGYDSASQTLEIEFKDGNIYQYFDVPNSQHLQLMDSGSIGTFFSANIRNSYRYARL